MNTIMFCRDKFNQWLLSDDYPLKIVTLLFISTVFDYFLTFQILFNNKELFLQLELNGFLVYSYQNNLWWLFAIWYSGAFIFMLWGCISSLNRHKKAFRIMTLVIVIYQLSQPLLFLATK